MHGLLKAQSVPSRKKFREWTLRKRKTQKRGEKIKETALLYYVERVRGSKKQN